LACGRKIPENNSEMRMTGRVRVLSAAGVPPPKSDICHDGWVGELAARRKLRYSGAVSTITGT
jgi:hypothetical protein